MRQIFQRHAIPLIVHADEQASAENMILTNQLLDIEEVLATRKEHRIYKGAILKGKSVFSCKGILKALQKREEDTNSKKRGREVESVGRKGAIR